MTDTAAPEIAPADARAALRRAARALIEADGLTAVTTRAVVERTWGRDTPQLLYAYYGSRDDLLTDVADVALAGVQSLGELTRHTSELVLRHASPSAWRAYLRSGGTAADVGACVLRARLGGGE